MDRLQTASSLSVRPHAASMEDAIVSRTRRSVYGSHDDRSNTDLLPRERWEANGRDRRAHIEALIYLREALLLPGGDRIGVGE